MSVPRLRFKADDGSEFPELIDSKLQSLCEFYNGDRGKNYPNSNDIVNEGIPFINAGDLENGKVNLSTANKITREKYNTLGGAKIKKFDIVYCLRGSLGKNAFVDNMEEATIASSLVDIRAVDINAKYLFYLLNTDAEYRQRQLNDEGCAQPNLSAKNVGEFTFSIPCYAEQCKIADFFSTLDQIIDKTQAEVDAWEKQKQGMMQKLFSQEIRFKAGDGSEYPEWEEKTVNDIFELTRGYVLSVDKTKEKPNDVYKFPVYSSQTKNDGLMGYYSEYLYEDSITWTTDGANAGTVKYRKGKFYCTNVCGVLINKNGFANQCVAEILGKKSKKYVSYVGNPKLMNNIMAEIPIYIPSSLEEQRKIADCLSSFDKVIDKTKQELEAYKQLKKGLMQQMFV